MMVAFDYQGGGAPFADCGQNRQAMLIARTPGITVTVMDVGAGTTTAGTTTRTVTSTRTHRPVTNMNYSLGLRHETRMDKDIPGHMSITDLYDVVEAIGRDPAIAGGLVEVSIFSHSFEDGPLIVNTDDSSPSTPARDTLEPPNMTTPQPAQAVQGRLRDGRDLVDVGLRHHVVLPPGDPQARQQPALQAHPDGHAPGHRQDQVLVLAGRGAGVELREGQRHGAVVVGRVAPTGCSARARARRPRRRLSEAVEVAIRMAQLVTGRSGVLSFASAFHGKTLGTRFTGGRHTDEVTVSYFRDRPTAKINELVLSGRETVDILEISLHTMRNITADQWRGCAAPEPRIILLDPNYPRTRPLAKQRDAEENQKPGTILREVFDFVHNLPGEWFDGAPRLKLARTMPTVSYFRIDGVAYVSPYVHQRVGDATLHLELAEGGEYFEVMASHFEALWDDRSRVLPARPASIHRSYRDH